MELKPKPPLDAYTTLKKYVYRYVKNNYKNNQMFFGLDENEIKYILQDIKNEKKVDGGDLVWLLSNYEWVFRDVGNVVDYGGRLDDYYAIYKIGNKYIKITFKPNDNKIEFVKKIKEIIYK